MRLCSALALYSNVQRKHRQMRGTYMFVYRFYMLAGVCCISGISFIGLYFSPFQDIVRANSKSRDFQKEELRSILNPVDIRTTKEMERAYLEDRRLRDLTFKDLS